MTDEPDQERLMMLASSGYWEDPSVIEAASWRLASELMRRHPRGARLFIGYPGMGQYDLLWIRSEGDPVVEITLNRVGRIKVESRGDGRPVEWEPAYWIEYLSSAPRQFLERLEAAAAWPAPNQVPASTPETLTYRVLAALAAIGTKAIAPIRIVQGFIDSSGYGGGRNEDLDRFQLPTDMTARREDDLLGEAGYRFWLPMRNHQPLMAIEQSSATAWFIGSDRPMNLQELYRSSAKEPALVAAELLRRSVTGSKSAG